MAIKGWAEAQRYTGGIIKYLYDVVKGLASSAEDVEDIKEAIGADDTEGSIKYRVTAVETAIGSESTEGSILARIKALEDAE